MSRSRRSPSPRSGFTLVELLIAATVALIMIAASAGLIMSGTRSELYTQKEVNAWELCRAAINYTRDIPFGSMPASGTLQTTLQNTFSSQLANLSPGASMSITTFGPDPTGTASVTVMTVQVQYTNYGKTRTVALSTKLAEFGVNPI